MLVLQIIANLSAGSKFIPGGKILKTVIHILIPPNIIICRDRMFIYLIAVKTRKSIQPEIVDKTLAVSPALLDLDPTAQIYTALEKLFHILACPC